ncbi:hypothetical protein PBY51_013312 [Eleginops maclovinus]|uniref:Uncharacterized protein n=1 Tax=Eleginops maclovinus TaxID=56733 RepID=A0AAN7Y216_ELEMC|nr:hypothetical protein PBY51_013312 [Eleginops maclovinus]
MCSHSPIAGQVRKPGAPFSLQNQSEGNLSVFSDRRPEQNEILRDCCEISGGVSKEELIRKEEGEGSVWATADTLHPSIMLAMMGQ